MQQLENAVQKGALSSSMCEQAVQLITQTSNNHEALIPLLKLIAAAPKAAGPLCLRVCSDLLSAGILPALTAAVHTLGPPPQLASPELIDHFPHTTATFLDAIADAILPLTRPPHLMPHRPPAAPALASYHPVVVFQMLKDPNLNLWMLGAAYCLDSGAPPHASTARRTWQRIGAGTATYRDIPGGAVMLLLGSGLLRDLTADEGLYVWMSVPAAWIDKQLRLCATVQLTATDSDWYLMGCALALLSMSTCETKAAPISMPQVLALHPMTPNVLGESSRSAPAACPLGITATGSTCFWGLIPHLTGTVSGQSGVDGLEALFRPGLAKGLAKVLGQLLLADPADLVNRHPREMTGLMEILGYAFQTTAGCYALAASRLLPTWLQNLQQLPAMAASTVLTGAAEAVRACERAKRTGATKGEAHRVRDKISVQVSTEGVVKAVAAFADLVREDVTQVRPAAVFLAWVVQRRVHAAIPDYIWSTAVAFASPPPELPARCELELVAEHHRATAIALRLLSTCVSRVSLDDVAAGLQEKVEHLLLVEWPSHIEAVVAEDGVPHKDSSASVQWYNWLGILPCILERSTAVPHNPQHIATPISALLHLARFATEEEQQVMAANALVTICTTVWNPASPAAVRRAAAEKLAKPAIFGAALELVCAGVRGGGEQHMKAVEAGACLLEITLGNKVGVQVPGGVAQVVEEGRLWVSLQATVAEHGEVMAVRSVMVMARVAGLLLELVHLVEEPADGRGAQAALPLQLRLLEKLRFVGLDAVLRAVDRLPEGRVRVTEWILRFLARVAEGQGVAAGVGIKMEHSELDRLMDAATENMERARRARAGRSAAAGEREGASVVGGTADTGRDSRSSISSSTAGAGAGAAAAVQGQEQHQQQAGRTKSARKRAAKARAAAAAAAAAAAVPAVAPESSACGDTSSGATARLDPAAGNGLDGGSSGPAPAPLGQAEAYGRQPEELEGQRHDGGSALSAGAGGDAGANAAAELRECFVCRTQPQESFLCGGCGRVRYCSKTCQRRHWKAHKQECRSGM